ncbi:outer membrane protein OmpV [Vibrio gallicus]|uniref:outer membrane protein OmpV n=1 Tax=Vibrio gallicus TaxID=190897 RepID=UPI0021C4B030|nr:MipA/OmpV family protein [Vibrio gallicus]
MKKISLTISAILLSHAALADAGNTYIRNGNIYSHEGKGFVGGGVITASKYYKGQKHQTTAYLNGGYHGEDFNVDLGNGINYRFAGNNDDILNMSVFMVANPGFDADDAKILKGMKDRDFSGDLGLNADFHLGQGTLSGKFQQDVTGVYKSFQTDLTYYHPMQLGFVDFVPYAGVHYYSEDFVNYYAGVSSSEATVGRPAYKADGAFAYKVGYNMIIPVTEHLDITQATGYAYLDSDLSDSPLIDSENQWATTVGVNYTF